MRCEEGVGKNKRRKARGMIKRWKEGGERRRIKCKEEEKKRCKEESVRKGGKEE